MKIIRFNAENFKRIAAVEITPTGNVVEVSGRNGQGKSSILDAIWVALAGLSAAPKKPIKSGALEARIALTLGSDKPEIVVVRTFKPSKDGTETTSTLRVENAEGAQFPSPQGLLDKLLGALAFDPLEFDRMDAADQFDALRRFVPGVDFAAIDEANRADYDKRTTANRKAREARNAASLQKFDPQFAAAVMVDEAALLVKMEQAGKHNTEIETRKANRERIRTEVLNMRGAISLNERRVIELQEDIAEINRQIAELRERNLAIDKDATMKEERLNAAGELPEPIDTTELRVAIERARHDNAQCSEHARRKEEQDRLLVVAREQDAIATQLTEAMDLREIAKREAIVKAALPIDGISFGENEVLLRSEPWSQASDAERLVASMQMAMAMNPKLRIVRVRDGSLLDGDSMKLVAEMAAKADYQVWIETVRDDGKVGIVIEDGRVKQQMTSADNAGSIAVQPQ